MIFQRLRIVETRGRFILQQWNLFSGWRGVDKSGGYLWWDFDNQIQYCGYPSLEEARRAAASAKLKIHPVSS